MQRAEKMRKGAAGGLDKAVDAAQGRHGGPRRPLPCGRSVTLVSRRAR